MLHVNGPASVELDSGFEFEYNTCRRPTRTAPIPIRPAPAPPQSPPHFDMV